MAALFSPETYHQRREALRARVGSGLILLPGATHAAMNYAGNPYPFWQDSSFAYFFGIGEPEHAGLIDCDNGVVSLYGPDDSLDDILWHGSRPTLEERGERVGVGATRPIVDLGTQLAEAGRWKRTIHYPPPYRGQGTLMLSKLLSLAPTDVEARASRPLIDAIVALREIKGDEEIAEMESALAVTADMHRAAMRGSRPGVFEYEIVSAMAEIAARNGRRFAYPPIFSRRGEVLHNMTHEGRLCAGDLVINDSGATSPMGYASDITRTIPVGGRFSARQREFYDIVLDAQTQAIAALRPGVPFKNIHLLAARVITDAMVSLGLMHGDPAELVADGLHALVFPSGLGHAIGLDTHDMEALGEDRVGYGDSLSRSSQFGLNHLRLAKPLRAGMVVTIEPGIYFIGPLIERWASDHRYAGRIDWDVMRALVGFGGIRIEDNILVTESGARTIGPAIAKSATDVEAAMVR